METKINKKIAVISGGFGMLGKAIGKRLSLDGFSVVLLYLSETEEEKNTILAEFSEGNIFAYVCDISDKNAVRDIVQKIETEIGPIYVGIHTAHIPFSRKRICDISAEVFHSQFSAGIFGGFNFLKEVSAFLLSRKTGVLIGITTSAIEKEMPEGNFGGYISAKNALKGMLQEFYSAVNKEGVFVYAVAPDFMEGGLNSDLPERVIELIKEREGGRITKPEEVAKIISHLCLGDLTEKENFSVIVDVIK